MLDLFKYIMTGFFTIALLLPVAGCSPEGTEEFVFRKTMEYQLKDDCEGDENCLQAIEEQIESCMEKSDWRKYVRNNEDEEELDRFIKLFFPCFKDADGNSYFGL